MIDRFILLALLAAPALPAQPASSSSDLDLFMARVLARRDDNWQKLQQYVLEEREQAELLGPGRVRLYGVVRDYTWYIRDGVFVRSPLKFDGVSLDEGDRRKYEDEWLAREKAREQKRKAKAPEPVAADVESLMRLSGEPRFVSAAYFLKFKFEQGRYAFAGPEEYDGRKVVKIEYYPARLFSDSGRDDDTGRTDDSRTERRLEQQFNKVALVTLWIEPDSHQIVKYVFENIGMDFLPGRSVVRVDDVAATMKMGQPFAGVWLPQHIEGRGGVTLANGTYEVRYLVDYRDYREAVTKAILR